MSYIKAVYRDLNLCCDEFIKGVELLEQCSIKDSIRYFKCAFDSVVKNHRLYSKYKSYYGFSCLLNGDNSAIDMCRCAAKSSTSDGDIYLNLARAEAFLSNRLNALQAITTGLRYAADHEGLKALQKKLGIRIRKPLPILSRDNPVSAALGKKMRKRY